ncbi:MAG: DUF1947 domain-containing protein [Nanoarchaeota archaeon]|nr:DUF1947 domain-containing protein [Nanoarchaeota archaeon]MBU1632386.1 DUF1947 domain-containing protein [Nanoarchaeota archaeon]MBU1876690.1 DUF1947 domain-containing protein [Nanoarchaeota archaeon]
MKRIQLRSKEINKELEKYKVNLNKKDQVELLEDKYKLININKKNSFFYYENKPVPTLKYLQDHDTLKKITVDMGAVKFVINGADIMRPGIVEIEEGIKSKELVTIIDENNKKPLAVGIALFDGEEIKKITSGKVIKNIHYVGDEIWKIER